MAFTKAKLVNEIALQNGFPKKQSVEIAETLLELIKKTLEAGDDVLFSGFGKFCVRSKEQRKGRNPSSGEDMMLRPRRVVTFKCSGKLRAKINGRDGQ